MEKLNEILSDNGGGLSSIRMVMLFWTILILFIWVYSSFLKGDLQPIPDSVVTIYLGVVGIKGIQRFGEKQAG